jgi:hypothetical protein
MTIRMLTVSTVVPAVIERGYVPVIARTRATDKNQVTTENRLRAITIPEFDVSDLPSKWAQFAAGQLGKIAVAQLQELWKQQGAALKETPVNIWSADSLLMFAAREAESKRLTGDSIATALSAFLASVNPKVQEVAKGILTSMAAPAKKGSEKQLFSLADKLAAFLATAPVDQDAEPNPIPSQVLAKMIERAEELKAQRLAFDEEEAFE